MKIQCNFVYSMSKWILLHYLCRRICLSNYNR